jgi:membrane protein YqaA with SNARE-associated domain
MSAADLYPQVFIEAAWLASIIPMGNDTAFHAMSGFGEYDMTVPVILAVIGATLGQMFNWYFGTLLQKLKYTKNLTMSPDAFIRFEYYFRRYGIYLLLFSWGPLCKLLPVLAGFANVPPKTVALIVAIGYIGHYGYAAFF